MTQAARRPDRFGGRKLRGDFPTPPTLVQLVVDAVMPRIASGQVVSVLDPACGDGRFLIAAVDHILVHGGRPVVHGVDVDAEAVRAAALAVAQGGIAFESHIEHGDALTRDWAGAQFDVVLGNPPYLSQMAAATTRGRSSTRGGGPYADAAAEFLVLAVERARADGGRVGLVLPQSILRSRDAEDIRASVDQQASMIWSWWSPRKQFDADVLVCALGFERRPGGTEMDGNSAGQRDDCAPVWSDVIVRSLGVPALPNVNVSGTAGGRATFTANFRDEYYGMIGAVGEHASGPRLVTSGLIDPDRCWWGERSVRFNKRVFERPRIDVGVMSERMQGWARRLSVPKVLIANQTKIIECVVDRDGTSLPGVPVVTARPTRQEPAQLDAIAAVLSSSFASAWAWHRVAGTGLSARTVRVGPALLADVPWPAGRLNLAADAWRQGDLGSSASAVHAAYGIDEEDDLLAWWRALLP